MEGLRREILNNVTVGFNIVHCTLGQVAGPALSSLLASGLDLPRQESCYWRKVVGLARGGSEHQFF